MFMLYKAGTDDLKDLNLPVDKSVRTDISGKAPESSRRVLRILVFGLGSIIVVSMTVAVVAWSRSQEDTIPKQPSLSDNENFQGAVSISVLEQHNTASDCWIALYGNVYNLSAYDHPGAQESISRHCGLDTTTEYASIHPQVLVRTIEHLYLGIYQENAVDIASQEATIEPLLGKSTAVYGDKGTADDSLDDSGTKSSDNESEDSDD